MISFICEYYRTIIYLPLYLRYYVSLLTQWLANPLSSQIQKSGGYSLPCPPILLLLKLHILVLGKQALTGP